MMYRWQYALTSAYQREHKNGGRAAKKLPVGNRLLLTLQYWREYRTMKHIAYDFGVAKSTLSDTIHWVENTLIQDRTFPLPGKKALLSQTAAVRKIAVDVTENPVERPKKNKKNTIAARKSGTP